MPKYYICNGACRLVRVDSYMALTKWCCDNGFVSYNFVSDEIHIEDEHGMPVHVPRRRQEQSKYKRVR